jgi:vacuolar-type H+-ATPase subunit D/Vma8
MENKINVKIEDYLVDEFKIKKNSIIMYFNKLNSEYELLKIGFYNGTKEMDFLLHLLDDISNKEYLNSKVIKIASIDNIPVALVDQESDEICIIKFPVDNNSESFIYKENIHNLQLRYKKTIETFEELIKEKIYIMKKEKELKLKLEMCMIK